MADLTDDDVREILRIVDEAGPAEVRVQARGFSLHVRRGAGEDGGQRTEDRAVAPAFAAPPPPPPPSGDANAAIESPMVGIFYIADAPGEPPFVEVGATVEEDTVVGIIEVMKMMNTVPAGVRGTIAEVCVENAELVDEGQTLFRVVAA